MSVQFAKHLTLKVRTKRERHAANAEFCCDTLRAKDTLNAVRGFLHKYDKR